MAGTKKAVKKIMEDYLDRNETEIDLQDKAIENLLDVPYLSTYKYMDLSLLKFQILKCNKESYA